MHKYKCQKLFVICFTWANINRRSLKEVYILSPSSLWPLTISSTQAAGCTLPPSSMSLVIIPDHQSLCLHPNNPWHFPWGSLETASFNEESMKESGFNVSSVEYLVLKCYVQFMMLLRGFTVTCIKQTFYTSCHDGYYHHHPLDQTMVASGLKLSTCSRICRRPMKCSMWFLHWHTASLSK